MQIKLKESCHRVLRDCVQLTEGLVSQTNQWENLCLPELFYILIIWCLLGGDYQCNSAQMSNNISSRSTCLKIKPTNLLKVFSKSDSNKQTTFKMPSIYERRESGQEDDSIEPINHYSYGIFYHIHKLLQLNYYANCFCFCRW